MREKKRKFIFITQHGIKQRLPFILKIKPSSFAWPNTSSISPLPFITAHTHTAVPNSQSAQPIASTVSLHSVCEWGWRQILAVAVACLKSKRPRRKVWITSDPLDSRCIRSFPGDTPPDVYVFQCSSFTASWRDQIKEWSTWKHAHDDAYVHAI